VTDAPGFYSWQEQLVFFFSRNSTHLFQWVSEFFLGKAAGAWSWPLSVIYCKSWEWPELGLHMACAFLARSCTRFLLPLYLRHI